MDVYRRVNCGYGNVEESNELKIGLAQSKNVDLQAISKSEFHYKDVESYMKDIGKVDKHMRALLLATDSVQAACHYILSPPSLRKTIRQGQPEPPRSSFCIRIWD